MIVHGCALGLTGEIESDYAENLGSGMIVFAALGAVGYSGCFLYSWYKDVKEFNEELGDEFVEPKKGVLGQLQSFKNNTINMLGLAKKQAQSEETEVQQLQRTNTLSRAWRVARRRSRERRL